MWMYAALGYLIGLFAWNEYVKYRPALCCKAPDAPAEATSPCAARL